MNRNAFIPTSNAFSTPTTTTGPVEAMCAGGAGVVVVPVALIGWFNPWLALAVAQRQAQALAVAHFNQWHAAAAAASAEAERVRAQAAAASAQWLAEAPNHTWN